jgi:prepilin-type N-terminal cleavage/methylation domain-containing protein
MTNNELGFSTFELILVVAVISIIAAMALPQAVNSIKNHRAHSDVQGSAGYTLLELLIALAVVCVVAAMAIPTTLNALRDYRLTAAVSAASGAISATRYQAIMHAYPYNITFNSTNATY